MLLPIIALVAFWICEAWIREGKAVALAAALSTVIVNRPVQLLIERFRKRVEAVVDTLLPLVSRQSSKAE